MFVITQSSSYKWSVKVKVPVDGGRFDEHTFDAVFKRLPQSRIEEMRSSVAGEEYTPKAIAQEIVVGWSGVQDANGDIPFSEDALKTVLELPGVAASIVIAFFDSINGITRKN
jgi:hypothetical protein